MQETMPFSDSQLYHVVMNHCNLSKSPLLCFIFAQGCILMHSTDLTRFGKSGATCKQDSNILENKVIHRDFNKCPLTLNLQFHEKSIYFYEYVFLSKNSVECFLAHRKELSNDGTNDTPTYVTHIASQPPKPFTILSLSFLCCLQVFWNAFWSSVKSSNRFEVVSRHDSIMLGILQFYTDSSKLPKYVIAILKLNAE